MNAINTIDIVTMIVAFANMIIAATGDENNRFNKYSASLGWFVVVISMIRLIF